MAKGYLLLLLLVPLRLHASTLSMQQRVEENQRHFSYQFQAQERDYRLQFSLTLASIRVNSNLVRVFIPEVFEQQQWRELQQQVRLAGPYLITPGGGRDGLNFQLKRSHVTTSPLAAQAETERLQLLQQLQLFSKQYQQQQLSAAGYQLLQLPDNRQQIMVDHPRIVQQSLVDIAPVAQSAASQFAAIDQRQFITILLNWVQLIPAHPTEQAEHGQTYTPPLQMLLEHQGDSASKTVLLAALLRSSQPSVKQAILYSPDRTMLALAIPAEPGELTVNLQGTTYLVADPSGPAKMLLGQVAEPQRLYIVNQYFAYRLF